MVIGACILHVLVLIRPGLPASSGATVPSSPRGRLARSATFAAQQSGPTKFTSTTDSFSARGRIARAGSARFAARDPDPAEIMQDERKSSSMLGKQVRAGHQLSTRVAALVEKTYTISAAAAAGWFAPSFVFRGLSAGGNDKCRSGCSTRTVVQVAVGDTVIILTSPRRAY